MRAFSPQKHDRPTRWVLEVARQKVLELKQHCETRQAMGDSKFSESLELMCVPRRDLVGIQHIQRFRSPRRPAKADAPPADRPDRGSAGRDSGAPTQRTRVLAEEPTREMPQLKAVKAKVEFPFRRRASREPEARSTCRRRPRSPHGRSSARPAPKINSAAARPPRSRLSRRRKHLSPRHHWI